MAFFPNNNIPDVLIPSEVTARFFQEYVGLTPVTPFMGSVNSRAVIQVADLGNGGGLTYQFPLLQRLDPNNPAVNLDILEGKEQELKFLSDTITLRQLRFGDRLNMVSLTKAVTPLNVFNALRPSLLEVCQVNLTESIFKAGTKGLYPDPRNGIPVYDRGRFCGVTTARNAWYNNINAGVEAMTAGAAYNQNGLSVQTLRDLKKMAIGEWGNLYNPERKITPSSLITHRSSVIEEFMLLTTQTAAEALIKDPEWQAQVNRGIVVSQDQPESLRGSRYQGTMYGIHVYACPELTQYMITSNNITASWSLFCGAQAFGLVWSSKPDFKMKEYDYDSVAMRSKETRGEKALVYPSKQKPDKNAENGIIHVFSRIN